MLELAFATKELRSICEDGARALNEYGSDVASALLDRLADLRAASHPLELPVSVSQHGTDGANAHLVIVLGSEYSLVVAPNHRRPPLREDGSVAWERVSRVIIIRIDKKSA